MELWNWNELHLKKVYAKMVYYFGGHMWLMCIIHGI
jgi:hypothetical protein